MSRILFTLILSGWIFMVNAQSGKVLESLKFESKIVSYPVEYSVYLPPGYDVSKRSYPVLYLMHGFSDDETGWIQYGEADRILNEEIAAGNFPPSIVVIPNGKVTWFCNSADGSDMWENMFINEFLPFIESTYRARNKKEFRAIAGLSMGGNAALFMSMRHPELFSSCVALSPATFTDEEIVSLETYKVYFQNIFGENLVGAARLNDHWRAYSPLHIIETTSLERLKSVRYYIDCGDDDFLFRGNSALHDALRMKGIPHEYRVRDGAHEWEYWRSGLPEGLKFVAKQFHR